MNVVRILMKIIHNLSHSFFQTEKKIESLVRKYYIGSEELRSDHVQILEIITSRANSKSDRIYFFRSDQVQILDFFEPIRYQVGSMFSI